MDKISEKQEPGVPRHTYSRLTLGQCFGLGAGGVPDIGMQYAIKNMANPIFNVIYGVNPVLIGIAFALPRFWEMLIDPWIGSWSDRTRGRLGRRHPYMIWGGLFGGLTFALVWWVPGGLSENMAGWWLIIFALLHFTAYSFFMVPYSALLGEVSTMPEERMKAMSYRTMFVNIGVFCMGWLYWLCQLDCFKDPAEGMKYVGIGFGLILFLGAFIPTLVCKRNREFYETAKPKEDELGGFAAVKELWKVRSFRCILISIFCLLTSGLLISNLGFYISLYFMYKGDAKSVAVLGGIAATVNTLISIFFCPMLNVVTRKIGEKKTLYLFLLVTIAGYIATFWAAHPAHPYATLVTGALPVFGQTAFWVIMPAITGELGRKYEVETGRSIYGSFFALFGMSIKVGASVGLLFTGFVLNLTGYQASYGVDQADSTLFLMRVLNASVPVAGVLLSMYFIYAGLRGNSAGKEYGS